MKSIVKNVKPEGVWEAHDKTFHKFLVTMENGNEGEYSSPKHSDCLADDFPFQQGKEAEYEFEAHPTYPKVKLPKKEYKPQNKGNNYSNVSMGVSYCKDLIVAGKLDIEKWEAASEKIINFMNRLDK